MEKIEQGQVTDSAAEIYETFFLPALFDQWPPKVAQAAQIKSGDHVLDVACGTGVLARHIINLVGESGEVTGLDINPGMLAVAKRKSTVINWQEGKAEALPFEDATFDAVVSQFGLMFFDNRQAAIDEMIRVLKPGGHLAVAVWDTLENTPGYLAMVALLTRLFGAATANGLRMPYVLGDVQTLRPLFERPQLENVIVKTCDSVARFESVEKWVFTDIKGWVLSEDIDDVQFEHLVKEAEDYLSLWVAGDGHVEFTAPGHIVSAIKKPS